MDCNDKKSVAGLPDHILHTGEALRAVAVGKSRISLQVPKKIWGFGFVIVLFYVLHPDVCGSRA